MSEERRKRSRVPLKLEVLLILDHEEIPVESVNLSLKGILCRTPHRFPLYLRCHVTISLTPDVRVVVEGRIVRSSEAETAVDFLEMDSESFATLKKIVEYNAGNAEKITMEILTPAFS